jgi:hypothetical protein
MNQKNRKTIIGSFSIVAVLWLVCASANLLAQTRILEGRLLNLAGEPVVGATGVLGTNNKETSVTGGDGYYIFTTTQNPTYISITPQDVSKLKSGPVRREIVDLTGRIIDSQEGYLGVGDELDGFSSAAHLKHHSVYIQRLIDANGETVKQKFVSVPNTVDQLLNETKAILKSASAEVGQNTIQNFNADFSGPTFKDTVLVLPIVRTAMSAYNDLRVNEKPAFISNYSGESYATAETMFNFAGHKEKYRLISQREGETTKNYIYKSFLTISSKPATELLTEMYQERWSIEDFFNFDGAMGFDRASTFNLNIRYGKMSLALLAQAATYELRKKLPKPYNRWNSTHLADAVFTKMDGDIRVKDDTIIVTCYNTPKELLLQNNYQGLPAKLISEGINPKVPWLYDYKLDFRFK